MPILADDIVVLLLSFMKVSDVIVISILVYAMNKPDFTCAVRAQDDSTVLILVFVYDVVLIHQCTNAYSSSQ